jgi:ribosomal protein L11 methylase PrmA
VLGIDLNPGAPGLARTNAAINGADRATFATTPLAELTGRFDLVIANLWSAVSVRENAPALLARSAGGHLLLSGFKGAESEEVERIYTGAGLRLLHALEREGGDGRVWAALLLRDPAPRAIPAAT